MWLSLISRKLKSTTSWLLWRWLASSWRDIIWHGRRKSQPSFRPQRTSKVKKWIKVWRRQRTPWGQELESSWCPDPCIRHTDLQLKGFTWSRCDSLQRDHEDLSDGCCKVRTKYIFSHTHKSINDNSERCVDICAAPLVMLLIYSKVIFFVYWVSASGCVYKAILGQELFYHVSIHSHCQ